MGPSRPLAINTRMHRIDRRRFLRVTGLTLAAGAAPRLVVRGEEDVVPAGTAAACILIKLIGGASQVDTFDLKEGSWTPPDFDVVDCGAFRLSRRLFPRLCAASSELALVRSFEPWDLLHGDARHAMAAGRRLRPDLGAEIPHIGSVVALELGRRKEPGSLPPFVAIDTNDELGSGFLGARFGVELEPRLVSSSAPEIETAPPARLPERDLPGGGPGRGEAPEDETLSLGDDERGRYGETPLGDACAIARKLVERNAGTRFVVIDHAGDGAPQAWDTHLDIYAPENLPLLCRELDGAAGALLEDLRAASLLDTTLVVVAGEFGRTGGPLNETGGRDHWPVATVLFAGGGVRGGRVLGATDELGARIVDPGWRDPHRPTRVEDLAATIYSALGVNWTRAIAETPSGDPYRYTPPSRDGEHGPLPLFEG